MRVLRIADDDLQVDEVPDPVPGDGELLVRVSAAGVNGADILQRRGHYPAPPGVPEDIPGLELAGEVVGTGTGVRRFSKGQRVMGIVGGGAQAELALLHERVAIPVPEGLDGTTAGCLPEAFTTAFDALYLQASLRPGERVLVNGAAGGVGTAALQIARMIGAYPVGTVRSEMAGDRLRNTFGVTTMIAEAESEAPLEHGPFDVVLELVGAPNLRTSLKGLAQHGRICFIGVGAGFKGEINALHLMNKRGTVLGSTLRSLPLEDKAVIARAFEKSVLPHIEDGSLTVPIDRSFPLDKAPEAYDYFSQGGKVGKVGITM